MTRAELEQLAKKDPGLKPHLEKLDAKSKHDQEAWLRGWHQVKREQAAA